MTTPLIIPERMLRFLNSLPVTAEPLEWITAFRDELCILLGDVDRVMVNVNLGCDLQNPQTSPPTLYITLSPEEKEDGGVHVQSPDRERSEAERLLEYAKERGFLIEQYQPPHAFNYYMGGRTYLGTIFLWRERNKPPVSDDTLKSVAALEPFLIFALSYLVARRQQTEPADKTFLDALNSLSIAAGLSKQEQRVIVLQLFGHSYKEIADLLNVSLDGVKHHLKMIHRKTGARSYTELFAKYFMPRLETRDSADDSGDVLSPDNDVSSSAVVPEPLSLRVSLEGSYFTSTMTIGERLRKFGEAVFGSVEEFARALKVAPSNLQKYLNGERNPGLGMLQRLHGLGCNINGLIGIEGVMFADNEAGRLLWDRFGLAVEAQSEGEEADI